MVELLTELQSDRPKNTINLIFSAFAEDFLSSGRFHLHPPSKSSSMPVREPATIDFFFFFVK
jgi:hypothetical protein